MKKPDFSNLFSQHEHTHTYAHTIFSMVHLPKLTVSYFCEPQKMWALPFIQPLIHYWSWIVVPKQIYCLYWDTEKWYERINIHFNGRRDMITIVFHLGVRHYFFNKVWNDLYRTDGEERDNHRSNFYVERQENYFIARVYSLNLIVCS